MVTCRGCKAPVAWITSPKGRPMIVDRPVLREWILPTAQATDLEKATLRRVSLTRDDGTVSAGYAIGEGDPRAQLVHGRVSHWATCPGRQAFRKAAAR